MEYVPGIKINRIKALDQLGVDRQRYGIYIYGENGKFRALTMFVWHVQYQVKKLGKFNTLYMFGMRSAKFKNVANIVQKVVSACLASIIQTSNLMDQI